MPTDTTNALRARFEEWFKANGDEPVLLRVSDLDGKAKQREGDPYLAPDTSLAWRAWQAALATAQPEAKPEGVDAWECFMDVGYFDLWCVRPRGSRKFGEGFHVVRKEEAHALRDTLNSYVAQRHTRQAQGGGESYYAGVELGFRKSARPPEDTER